MSLPRTQRVAAYTLIVNDGRILLCRLSNQERNVGQWTLPGGGMEFGEHPEETARRETLEETGLAVDLGQLVKVDTRLFEFVDSHMHWIRFIYRADVSGGTMAYEADGSTDACGWFTREEAETLPLVELARLGVSLAFP